MEESILIRCDNCKTLNKVLKSKLFDGPVCGKCKNKIIVYNKPVVVTDANFYDQVLNSAQVVVVDFYASWCGPCKMFAPVFESFASKFAGQVKAVKIDTEISHSTSARYGIQSIPTLVIFKNGQEVKRISGALSEPQLENLVAPYL